MTPRTPEPPDFPASQLFLRRLAFSLVHDEARAEDLVQDTWAAWAAHRPSNLSEPRAWLARVLRNRAFNQKRGDARRARHETLAGRPDPSTPETDGTLEAQAQLLEALRKLDEPYRSTLVQRYYHDLAPKEIAGRSGTPLNTVKARLARGLEKLRAELDRRYGGDRSAWCHWLTVLGAPAAPVVGPGGTEGGAQGAAPFAGMGGGLTLLGWLGLTAALAVGAVFKSGWLRSPQGEKGTSDERQASVPARAPALARGEAERAPASSEQSLPPRASAPMVRPASKLSRPSGPPALPQPTVARSSSAAREDFDWPQYAGGANHDNYREREDFIFAPRVSWFLPGCAGQPTLRDGDLYTGGFTLLRLDPATGQLWGSAHGLLAEALALDPTLLEGGGVGYAGFDPLMAEELADKLRKLQTLDPNDVTYHTVAPAPAVTRTLVLARRTRDGGVSAFDRELEHQVWSWTPGKQLEVGVPWSRVPLCLASDELVLVAQNRHLIALRVDDGAEAWRFDCNGGIRMVPASDGERVYFGMEGGVLYCLDLATGMQFWRNAAAPGFGSSAPLVIGERVLVADAGLHYWEFPELDELEHAVTGPSRGRLLAFEARRGNEVWNSPVDAYRMSDLGLGPKRDYVVAGYGAEVGRFDFRSGKPDERHRVEAEPHPYGSPTVVGNSLVFGGLDGSLYVHELDSDKLRWAFRVVPGQAKVFDFVHTGARIYVSTSIGLFCLADDPAQAAPAAGFVLEWNGNPREPSFWNGK